MISYIVFHDNIFFQLKANQDVAGAIIVVVGLSLPGLITNVIGVFVSFKEVGFGSIVGSALFKVLFVTAIGAFFTREPLRYKSHKLSTYVFFLE